MSKPAEGVQVVATNRKALFHYEVVDRAEAGISLLGSEIKSIRTNGLDFRDAHVAYRGGEMFMVGLRIAPYVHANQLGHVELRDRKLLLHRREIDKLGGKVAERGLALIPLKAYFKNGRLKIELGLGRGKKAHDKRETLRRRETERETRQALARRR